MPLVPVDNKPGLFRDTITGQVFNVREYRGSDLIFPFEGGRAIPKESWQPEPGASMALQAWSFLMYPWPEVIPVTLRAKLYVNGDIMAEGPLFALAEPLVRAEDEEIRERLRVVEEKIETLEIEMKEAKKEKDLSGDPRAVHIPSKIYPVTRLRNLVDMKHKLWAEIEGPGNDFVPLREKLELLALRLRGVGREPVKD